LLWYPELVASSSRWKGWKAVHQSVEGKKSVSQGDHLFEILSQVRSMKSKTNAGSRLLEQLLLLQARLRDLI
jgi:hypothetical protein